MAAPTLVVISGSHDFLRRRSLEQTVTKQRTAGWDIQVVDGSDSMGFLSALHQSAGMFGDGKPVLVIVHNPEKAPLSALENHAKDPSPAATVLLSIEGEPKGNTKFGKFILGLDKKAHMAYPLPDKWDIPKFATQFCVTEAKRMGKPMTEELAGALVKTSGVDFGFLAFELQKAFLHAEARGSATLDFADVKATVAPMGEVSFDAIKDALATRNRKTVAMALGRIKKLVKDPTMKLCGFLEAIILGSMTEKEGKTSFGWLHLTVMVAQGMDSDQIADALGVKPFRCKTYLLPEVRAWNPKALLDLVRATSQTRRAVVTDQLDPWLILVAGILKACVVR